MIRDERQRQAHQRTVVCGHEIGKRRLVTRQQALYDPCICISGLRSQIGLNLDTDAFGELSVPRVAQRESVARVGEPEICESAHSFFELRVTFSVSRGLSPMSVVRLTERTQAAAISPPDEANIELVNRVHPPAWNNPRPASKYDLVVLGGGTAGLVSAMGAVGLGARVALIERQLLGGDCLNTGCVPSKAVIRSARVVGELKRASALGVSAGSVGVDFVAVMRRMRQRRGRNCRPRFGRTAACSGS